MQCPICKKEVDGRFEICSNCGAMLYANRTNPNYYNNAQPQQPQAPMRPPVPQQMQPPMQPPIPQPIPQPNGVMQNDGKKNTKLIIILAIVGIVIVSIIAGVIIFLNTNNNDADTGDTYITNNYNISFESDMIAIQKEFMEDGRVPKDKYPELLDKQCKYLNEHKEEYHITNIERNDTNIIVHFEDAEDWTYDPESFYDDEDEKTTKAEADLSQIEKDLVDNAFGCVGANMEFRYRNGGIYYTNGDRNPSALYQFNPESSETEKILDLGNEGFNYAWSSIYYDGVGLSCYNSELGGDYKNVVYRYDTAEKENTEYGIYEWTNDTYYSSTLDTNGTLISAVDNNEVCTQNCYYVNGCVLVLFQYFETGKFKLCKLSNDGSKILEVISEQNGFFNVYVTEDDVYYPDGKDVKKYNPKTGDKETVTTVEKGIDNLYFVYEDTVYYSHWEDDATATIYKASIKSGKSKKLANDYYPMDGD